MRVLITGATGFIGSALCREMLEHGHEITALLRPDSQRKNKVPDEVKVIELPLDRVSELEGRFDLCYHLAWNGSSGNERNDFDIQLNNVQYTVDVIRTAKRVGCRKFVGAGSQAEYGIVRGPCREDKPTEPFMMYGAAKLSAYHMGRLVAAQEGIQFVWPRIYSVYGAGENPGTLMSYLLDCLQNGTPAELSPCENMWDFMYITDCVKALRMLGESENTEGVYNVSAGNPALLKSFVDRAKAVINPLAEIRFGAKESDPNRTFWLEPDVTRLRETGFRCEVEFEDGVRRKSPIFAISNALESGRKELLQIC